MGCVDCMVECGGTANRRRHILHQNAIFCHFRTQKPLLNYYNILQVRGSFVAGSLLKSWVFPCGLASCSDTCVGGPPIGFLFLRVSVRVPAAYSGV